MSEAVRSATSIRKRNRNEAAAPNQDVTMTGDDWVSPPSDTPQAKKNAFAQPVY